MARGLDLPYKEHVAGFDTNIHVAILSRFPFTACRSHTNEDFLLGGRRFRISRGFGEVDVRVNVLDTRPAEPNGDNAPSSNPAWAPRAITWTDYYGKKYRLDRSGG